ncbi:molybdopterin oxidoreductase [Mobiluncus mulieris]|nr:molybdopterin oxidoreductase [Mobiluncus mulieris]MCV0012197.1 molybdopterin oxidoreductase [Mobiluncus mulieris]MCV0013739.1 molybdopterin oxidoreductase [Mobiluncus mulieris]NMW81216.1 molybdopterin oxidoreductase [Mobiluncus mulieris]
MLNLPPAFASVMPGTGVSNLRESGCVLPENATPPPKSLEFDTPNP